MCWFELVKVRSEYLYVNLIFKFSYPNDIFSLVVGHILVMSLSQLQLKTT